MGRFIVKTQVRSLKELAGSNDLQIEKLRTLKRDPFACTNCAAAKIVGICEGKVIGGEYVFPVCVKARGMNFCVLAGSTLFVDEQYRRSGLGMDLPELRWQKSPSKIALGASLSQMALPVHQLLDYVVFLLPRNVMLWRSRALVETKMKGFVAKCASVFVDCLIYFYALALSVVRSCKLAGIKIDEVAPDDETTIDNVSALIAEDGAPFAEIHNAQWFKWHMTESFSKDGPLRLCVARRKGAVIGFYMTKKRFHEQASHRGFKNVWLGSVVEWQIKPEFENKLGWLLIDAALRLKKSSMDAVEIPTADKGLNQFFRHLGWCQIGESNFVIKAGEGSSLFGNEEMTKIENWRLRPAMGDAGLS